MAGEHKITSQATVQSQPTYSWVPQNHKKDLNNNYYAVQPYKPERIVEKLHSIMNLWYISWQTYVWHETLMVVRKDFKGCNCQSYPLSTNWNI